MRTSLFLILFGFLSLAPASQAAYRVYALKVEHLDEYGRTDRVEMTLSHLDPHQYEQYFGGVGRERVTLTDTWYCPGDTSLRRSYCPPPPKPKSGRTPASADRTRVPLSRQPIIPR